MKRSKRKQAPQPGLRVIIGGPSYQMLVDARHAGAMVNLALRLRMFGIPVVAVNYQHGCPVEMPRNNLFRAALSMDATTLIWADSDCFWDDAGAQEFAWIAYELERQGLPFCALPVMQRNGKAANIVVARDGTEWERIAGTLPVARELIECEAAGLGVAVFNLKWYRRHWSEGPHFRTDWPEGTGFVSEDFWHTSQLWDRFEVKPRYAVLTAVHHAARGGDVAAPMRAA